MATLLELAKDAFQNRNYILSCEIYERLLRENGRKTTELYFGYGDSLAKCSRIKDALDIYCHICYQLCEIIPVEKLKCLASSIIEFIISKRTNQEVEHVDPLCCPICEDVLKYPVTSLCGHTFCRECCFGRTKCIVCGQKFPVINTTAQHQLEQQPSTSADASAPSTGTQVMKNSTITSELASINSENEMSVDVDDAGGRCGGFEQDILIRRLVEKWWSPLLKASELNEEAERYLERNSLDEALKSCNQSLDAGKLKSFRWFWSAAEVEAKKNCPIEELEWTSKSKSLQKALESSPEGPRSRLNVGTYRLSMFQPLKTFKLWFRRQVHASPWRFNCKIAVS